MQSIGFLVDLDDSAQQPDDACGVVAAHVAKRMHEPDWRHAKPDWCADPLLNKVSRRVLRIGHDAWLGERDIWHLLGGTVMSMNYRPSIADSMGIYPRDRVLMQMKHDVLSSTPVMRICVCNSAPAGKQGSHWFTVAYSIQKKS